MRRIREALMRMGVALVGGAAWTACSGVVVLGGEDADGGLRSSTDSGSSPALVDANGGLDTGRGDATVTSVDASDGPGLDASAVSADGGARPDASTMTPVAPGLAGIAFVINGLVQTPMACPVQNWSFPIPTLELPADPETSASTVCGFAPPCAGLTSVLLVNRGSFPVAYTAMPLWNSGSGYPPGVDFGNPNMMTGVIAPGGQVDIVSVYIGGILAVIGSSAPLSDPNANRYVADEGIIPWPAGVSGSEGATQMYVATLQIVSGCGSPSIEW